MAVIKATGSYTSATGRSPRLRITTVGRESVVDSKYKNSAMMFAVRGESGHEDFIGVPLENALAIAKEIIRLAEIIMANGRRTFGANQQNEGTDFYVELKD